MRAHVVAHPLFVARRISRAMAAAVQVELPGGIGITLRGLKRGSTVSVIKTRIEHEAGVLPHTYYLTYLDSAPLEDDKTLSDLDIVNGAVLRAMAWRLWKEVVSASLRGDVRKCCEELRAIGGKGDESWLNYCAWCSIFTAAHGGHYVLLSELLGGWPGLAVNAQSPSGWTAMHAAAAMGRWRALCILLDHGADVTNRDKYICHSLKIPSQYFIVYLSVEADQRQSWHTAMVIRNASRAFVSVSGTSKTTKQFRRGGRTTTQAGSEVQRIAGPISLARAPG